MIQGAEIDGECCSTRAMRESVKMNIQYVDFKTFFKNKYQSLWEYWRDIILIMGGELENWFSSERHRFSSL